ncbi:MAG TPA: head GIN domain-containing protein [Steroidobacteraceae bacterium]|nr:head GIN domain-containing protein [Steroidobacteraceae bacterium]
MVQQRLLKGSLAAAAIGVFLLAGCSRPDDNGSDSDRDRDRQRASRDERRAERRGHDARDLKMDTRNFPVEAFDAVELRGAAEVVITLGSAPSLQISGTERALKSIDVHVGGHTLDIDAAKGRSWFGETGRLKIVITAPTLTKLESNGAGEIRIDGFNGGDVDLEFAGAHDVVATGVVDKLKIELSGAGSADFLKVVAREADVTVNGAGNIELNTTESLRAEVNGVGAVRYLGDPQKVDSDLHGLGTISRKSKPE